MESMAINIDELLILTADRYILNLRSISIWYIYHLANNIGILPIGIYTHL